MEVALDALIINEHVLMLLTSTHLIMSLQSQFSSVAQ